MNVEWLPEYRSQYPEPKCRKCGAPPTEAIVYGESGIGEPVTYFEPDWTGYNTADIDPADYAPVDYVECSCGEQAGTIYELMGG
jgi:hypothetical protein